MIDLYAWATPNSRKVTIMLEETGLDYILHPVRIREGEQHKPDFLEINPNNKIPALVDHETGVQTFESGAILIYLAEKTGSLLPVAGQARASVLHWLMWQMSGFGPMLGKVEHFSKFNSGESPFAEKHFHDEALRLYQVLETRLSEAPYLGGDDYSIADIATWPWVGGADWQGVDLTNYRAITRWFKTVGARDAVKRGCAAVVF